MAAQVEDKVDGTMPKPQESAHLAVNDSCINRLLVRFALKTLGRFHEKLGASTPISRRLIIRSTERVDLTEVATMKFIAANTTIPVPKVYCAFKHKGLVYILMERIKGDTLPEVWRKLDEAGRESVFEHLRSMMNSMRALKPPEGTGVASCIGGSLLDFRIGHSRLKRFGPFNSIQSFHSWLREGLKPEDHPGRTDDDDWKELKKMVALQDGPWPSSVFTHGDLNPTNILVKDQKIAGIIDWEFAGWYPHYWEYTAAWYGALTYTNWQDSLLRFMVPYTEELKMEMTRQRWWGDM